MRSQDAPSWARGMPEVRCCYADTNSKCSLPNHIIAMAGGNRPIAGKLHYSSLSSVVMSSMSSWDNWRYRKEFDCGIGIVGQEVSSELWLPPDHCPPFWPATLTMSALLPVSGLSLVLHILLTRRPFLYRRKSTFCLVIWFTLNTSIWCIEIISSSLFLVAVQRPQGIDSEFGSHKYAILSRNISSALEEWEQVLLR